MDVDHNISYDSVTILIPTLNEALTIENVIRGFQELGFDNILVIDGYSDDDTVEIAESCGVRVETQDDPNTGKGAALIEAAQLIETEYFVMIDGDETYDPKEVDRLLKGLEDGYAEVIGNRFANMHKDAMRPLHKFGNKAINKMFSFVTPGRDRDILSGYRAYRTEAFNNFPLEREQFGIETELSTRFSYSNHDSLTVPISYYPRPEGSEAELSSFKDGFDIIRTLFYIRRQEK